MRGRGGKMGGVWKEVCGRWGCMAVAVVVCISGSAALCCVDEMEWVMRDG